MCRVDCFTQVLPQIVKKKKCFPRKPGKDKQKHFYVYSFTDCSILFRPWSLETTDHRPCHPPGGCWKQELICWKCRPKCFPLSCLPNSTKALNMPTRKIAKTQNALVVFVQKDPLLGGVPIALTKISFHISRLQDFWTCLAQENKTGLRGRRCTFNFLGPAVLGDEASFHRKGQEGSRGGPGRSPAPSIDKTFSPV